MPHRISPCGRNDKVHYILNMPCVVIYGNINSVVDGYAKQTGLSRIASGGQTFTMFEAY